MSASWMVIVVLVLGVVLGGCVFDRSGLDPGTTDTGGMGDIRHTDHHGDVAQDVGGALDQPGVDLPILEVGGTDAPGREGGNPDLPVPDLPMQDLLAPDFPAVPDLPAQDLQTDTTSYSWKTGSWGTCVKNCQKRSVWCEGSDGTKVADSYCGGTKPAAIQNCGVGPCCSTDPLLHQKRCGGKEKVQWVHWGGDKGDAADQSSCAAKCTMWAIGQGYTTWCCQLYEDSQPGTNWVCRVYDAHSTLNGSSINFAGLGQCQ